MKVRRLGWLGTRTNEFQATARFFKEVLGLAPTYAEPDFATFALPGCTRDMVEVMGKRSRGACADRASRPVSLAM